MGESSEDEGQREYQANDSDSVDLSCTPMATTMKKMRTGTAVEKVRLFKREGGEEVHGGQKQVHSEKTKASSGTRHLMLAFPHLPFSDEKCLSSEV